MKATVKAAMKIIMEMRMLADKLEKVIAAINKKTHRRSDRGEFARKRTDIFERYNWL